MCANITCENNGICVSSYLLWSCRCLDSSLYSGTYCQDESSALATKQAISKSLGIVAIIALCCVVGFVIIMDILKYVFKIDPVDRERHRLKMEKEKKKQKKFRKKKIKKKKTVDLYFVTI
jgi:mannitol-specific phosphotransferase system IIBC component